MKHKKNLNLQYMDIKSNKDLIEVIYFLEKSFKWEKFKSNLLEQNLPKINRELNHHGVMIRSGKDIVGAILFFHQGFIDINDEKKFIINMSGWYISQEYRGLPGIALLRYMLEKFDQNILTNYSANKIASKILKGVGFKKMKLKRATILISDCIFRFSKIRIRDVARDSFKINSNFEIKPDKGIGIRFLEVKIKNQIFNLIIKKRVLRRSLFGISFNWKISSIVWSSNQELVSKYWKQLALKLLLKTKSMKLICDFSSHFPNEAKEKENEYLYYSKNSEIDYIWPIQCEMNIFD